MAEIPPMLIKKWRGTDAERFRAEDMARIEGNLNRLAELTGVPVVAYKPKTRASQFDYTEYQRAEDEVKALADRAGVSVRMETAWSYGRTVNYADFERLEREFFKVYSAQGGQSERVAWDEGMLFIDWLLRAPAWTGTGPYTYTVRSEFIKRADDMIAYVQEGSTDEEQAAAMNAVLNARCDKDGEITITALGLRPKADIKLRVITRVFKMNENKTLSSAGWQGSGPWTQDLTVSQNVASGIITPAEGTTPEQAKAFARAGLSISRASGRTVTVRALFAKPNINLNVIVLYESNQGA